MKLSRNKKIFAIVGVILMVVSGIAFIKGNQSANSYVPPQGPLVTGVVSFSNLSENVSSEIIKNNQDSKIPVSGSIQAFINLPPGDFVANLTAMNIYNDGYQAVGSGNLSSNGSFNFNLFYSFFSISEQWKSNLLLTRDSNKNISIMFEINEKIKRNGYVYIYTFANPIIFSPFNISQFNKPVFHINRHFILGKASAIVPVSNSTSTNGGPLYIKGPGGGGGTVTVTEQTSCSWDVEKGTTLDNINFPLLIFNNTSELTNGNIAGYATLGLIGTSLSFTTSQGFATSDSNVSNVNDWSFSASSTSSLSLSNGFVGSNMFEAPAPEDSAPINYIYLSGINMQITKYELMETETTREFYNGILIKTTTATFGTGNYQLQLELINSQSSSYSVGAGTLPSYMGQALQDVLTQNGTAGGDYGLGVLTYNNQISFTDLNNNLSSSVTSTEWQTVTNAASIGLASLGVAATIAAGVEAASAGTIGAAAVLALVVSMAGVLASVLAAASSVVISSSSVTSIYESSLHSFSEQNLTLGVYLNPDTLNFDGYNIESASPYIVGSLS